MKVKDLKHGQYFQCGGIICRYLFDNNPIIVYFNEESIGGRFSDPASFWEDTEINAINFQTAVALLVKECMEKNKYKVYDEFQSKPTTIPQGQYVRIETNISRSTKIGRVCEDDKLFYLQKDLYGVWDYAKNIQLVTPITFPQAVLYLTQQLINEN